MELFDPVWLAEVKRLTEPPFSTQTVVLRATLEDWSVDLTIDLLGSLVSWEPADPAVQPHIELEGPVQAVFDRLFGGAAERLQTHIDGTLRISGDFTRMILLDLAVSLEHTRRIHELVRNLCPDDRRRPVVSHLKPRSLRTPSTVETLGRTAELVSRLADKTATGCQVYVSVESEAVLDVAFGSAGPDSPMTTGTLVPWFCSSKPLFLVPFGRLWEEGLLDPTISVAKYVPYMQGKDEVCIGHLLTHTTGMSDPVLGSFLGHPDDLRAAIGAAPVHPELIGTQIDYAPFWAWFVLCDVLEAVTQRPWPALMEDVLLACNMEQTSLALRSEDTAETCIMMTATDPPMPFLLFNDPSTAGIPLPGTSVRGPIADLARFYETLLFSHRLLNDITIEALSARRRVGLEWSVSPVGDWGLGFEIESSYLAPERTVFGDRCSWRTFGHRGMQSSVGFADPETGVVVAVFMNLMVGWRENKARLVEIANSIYDELEVGRKPVI